VVFVSHDRYCSQHPIGLNKGQENICQPNTGNRQPVQQERAKVVAQKSCHETPRHATDAYKPNQVHGSTLLNPHILRVPDDVDEDRRVAQPAG
jgi:hypothetical protein